MVRFIHHFSTDPVNLNRKEKLRAVFCCFIAIFIVTLVTNLLIADSAPLLVASMGASAVILFIIPSSPLAQPWPFVGGQVCSALAGVVCAQYITETLISASLAVGSAVMVMLLLRCLHPPGAATALAPVLAGEDISKLGFDFVLSPVGINVTIMLLMALIMNRWLMKLDYPCDRSQNVTEKKHDLMPLNFFQEISEDELVHILKEGETFLDIIPTEIKKLIVRIEQSRFKQQHKTIRCADIMMREVTTVDYGTHVEDAWVMMYQQKLQAMPVIDSVHRVIGIVTRRDFLKHLNLNAYDSLEDNFRAFIRRSLTTDTDKPESIGHIMTKPVSVLSADAHIVELIPLMSQSGFRQIPILNQEKRLVGIVYQCQLIAALYQLNITQNQLNSR